MADEALQAALREMAGQIGAMGATVKSLETTWRQQEQAASDGRRELHRKFEELRDKVTSISTRVETMFNDLVNIKPTVAAVERAKEQAIGAGLFGKALWMIGGAMIASGAWLWTHIK